MPTTCPHCASTLSVSEGLCTRCGWNAPYVIRRQAPRQSEMSFVERYRGTDYETQPRIAVASAEGITRGRMFVLVSFASLSAVAAAVVLAKPPM